MTSTEQGGAEDGAAKRPHSVFQANKCLKYKRLLKRPRGARSSRERLVEGQ